MQTVERTAYSRGRLGGLAKKIRRLVYGFDRDGQDPAPLLRDAGLKWFQAMSWLWSSRLYFAHELESEAVRFHADHPDLTLWTWRKGDVVGGKGAFKKFGVVRAAILAREDEVVDLFQNGLLIRAWNDGRRDRINREGSEFWRNLAEMRGLLVEGKCPVCRLPLGVCGHGYDKVVHLGGGKFVERE